MSSGEYIIRDEERRANCIAELQGLPLDKPWRVSIVRYRKKRSLPQLRLLWAWYELVAGHIEEHTGCDREEIHEFAKAKFLAPKALEINGDWVETRSTKLLNSAEMSAFLDRIYAWATTELGLILPTPGAWEEHNGDMAAIREAMTTTAETNGD